MALVEPPIASTAATALWIESARDQVGRLQILPDHVDDALARLRRHDRMAGVGGRDRGRARQSHAERLGGAGHGRGGAHRHAMAGRAGDALFDLLPVLLGDRAGAQLRPVFPDVAARTQRIAAPVAAQHRARRHEDRRQVHRDRAHEQRRRGLVAAAHQHRAVGGIGAQRLLRLHRQKIAIHHRRRLLERLGQASSPAVRPESRPPPIRRASPPRPAA